MGARQEGVQDSMEGEGIQKYKLVPWLVVAQWAECQPVD